MARLIEKYLPKLPYKYHTMVEAGVAILFGVLSATVVAPFVATFGGQFALMPFFVGYFFITAGTLVLGCELFLLLLDVYRTSWRG